MSGSRQRRFAYMSLAILAVAFVGGVMASNSLLRGMRIDLTENDLYTLAPGTRSLLSNIEEPINLYLFFSDTEAADIQYLRGHATRVTEMLQEFVAAAGSRLSLNVIDPRPFSEEEDRAAQFGLTNLSLGSLGDSIYFGLAATNSIGDEAIVEVFDPNKESSLEYDLARLIYSLATPEKGVVGLLSGVPMTGGFDPQMQQPTPPWVVDQQVRQLFDVRNLATSFERVEEDIGLLWIVHPVGLDETTLYAIDQFLLGGGRALIFVDPLAEIAASAVPDPTGMGATTSSSLDPLFAAWGLAFDPSQIVADDRYGLSINTGASRPTRHIGLIGLDSEAIDSDDVVTSGLSSINLGTAGHLSTTEDATVTLVPLLSSSAESALLPAALFQFLQDPNDLLKGFVPDSDEYVVAARLQGSLNTAFPNGRPGEDIAATGVPAPHLTATENANVVVVADVDILSDRLWVQRQRSFLGQQLLTAFANNGDFVTNTIANLAGSTDLIGLQSRETFARPFDRVEALRRDADARFRATEENLQAQLAETEQRLGELQAARNDTDTGAVLMSPEQQAEIARFRDEQLRIRQELRTVQRELDSSIEGLGTTLKLTNIVLVPLGLALLALAGYWVRRKRAAG